VIISFTWDNCCLLSYHFFIIQPEFTTQMNRNY